MVDYNDKEWWSVIFRFHKADTFRKLFPVILCIGLFSFIVAWLEKSYAHGFDTHLKNLGVLHSILGFALSMLLVFRTNTAYDRWWEGRKLWGALVNNSRNLAIKLAALLPQEKGDDRAFFNVMISNYAFVLKNHLRKKQVEHEFEEHGELDKEYISNFKHQPNKIASAMTLRLVSLQRQGTLSNNDMLMLNNEFSSFTDICGGCERIANTPIPFSYSSFIKKFIALYILSLPIGYVITLGYYVIPVVMFVSYVLLSLEMIAEEVENPFGMDANDLPTDQIAAGIRTSVHDIFE